MIILHDMNSQFFILSEISNGNNNWYNLPSLSARISSFLICTISIVDSVLYSSNDRISFFFFSRFLSPSTSPDEHQYHLTNISNYTHDILLTMEQSSWSGGENYLLHYQWSYKSIHHIRKLKRNNTHLCKIQFYKVTWFHGNEVQ